MQFKCSPIRVGSITSGFCSANFSMYYTTSNCKDSPSIQYWVWSPMWYCILRCDHPVEHQLDSFYFESQWSHGLFAFCCTFTQIHHIVENGEKKAHAQDARWSRSFHKTCQGNPRSYQWAEVEEQGKGHGKSLEIHLMDLFKAETEAGKVRIVFYFDLADCYLPW